MSKKLKEKLKRASILNQQKKIAACFSLQFPGCLNGFEFSDKTFNEVLVKVDDKTPVIIPLSQGDDYFLKEFVDFSKHLDSEAVFLFYIELTGAYTFIKVNGLFIKSDPHFFWELKGKVKVSFCILTEEKGMCGFNLLYTEYGYELYEWK